MENILTTENLCKNYKKQKANDNISIEVPQNSIYGLLGPNGAGKSTLLKMITGMIQPSSGKITFYGKPWARKDLLNIGALIEEPPLYENLTAYENLKVRALLYDIPKDRIEEVLRIVELTDTGKKKAGQFSMGMKQRLGIAMALLNQPELLILDEPTNGLDPIGIQELRELIRSFPQKGITVILSSHILSEVEQIANHIGIIANGKLWYQEPIHVDQDLESLFMDVVRKSGAYNG
ncbi:MAG: lantibiotic protection ABC transporter ATP-binding protein [Lachnospiraceae bacterium]|nr:lantibiotic protection ABC transporter ATP-binding protein [Lachnospiraceae bacterium]